MNDQGLVPLLAILPFDTDIAATGDLVDGFTMDLIAAVTVRLNAAVLAWGTVRRLADRRVARRFRATDRPRHELMGRLTRDADRIEIDARLVDREAPGDLWRLHLTGSIGTLQLLRDRLAATIAATLEVDQAPPAGLRLQPVDPAAYEFFLLAQALAARPGEANNAAALYALLQARERGGDPTRIDAAIGRCAVARRMVGWPALGDDAEVRAQVRRAAERAPEDPMIQAAAAGAEAFLASHVDEAVRFADRALALTHNDAEIWLLSGWLRCNQGDFDIGEDHFKQAIRLSPLDPRPRLRLSLARAAVLFEQGETDAAMAACSVITRRAHVRDVDPIVVARAFFLQSLVHERNKSAADVQRSLEAAVAASPRDVGILHNLGQTLGKRKEAELSRGYLARAIAERVAFHPPRLGQQPPSDGSVSSDDASISEDLPMSAVRRRADARIFNDYGVVLQHGRMMTDSEEAFAKSSAIDPSFGSPLNNLGYLMLSQGRWDEALAAFRRLSLLDDTPNTRHMLAALSKENVPKRAADDYVENLFDDYAATFDHSLVNVLKYAAPDHVKQALNGVFPSPGGTLSILDAGCGTGLCGPFLRDHARRLVGVDLSTGMLQKARLRETYDDLVKAELTDHLAAANGAYDVVVAADVLVYFGDLQPVMTACATALSAGGRFFFTVEKLDDDVAGDGFRIERSGRYSQRADYLRRTAAKAGFSVERLDQVILRMEGGAPVHGYLVVLLKSLPL